MSIRVLNIETEHCSAARFIGRRYRKNPDWGEWWKNGWFAVLETIPRLPFNDDAYIGAVRIADGSPEYWIGMFFPEGTAVPEGFEAVDMESSDYAVCYLCGPEGSPDFYTMETHNLCLKLLEERGLARKEDSWCFERYQCPRFTTPDENGNVILDYGISIC